MFVVSFLVLTGTVVKAKSIITGITGFKFS